MWEKCGRSCYFVDFDNDDDDDYYYYYYYFD
jgi:hypothetical protein